MPADWGFLAGDMAIKKVIVKSMKEWIAAVRINEISSLWGGVRCLGMDLSREEVQGGLSSYYLQGLVNFQLS